MTPPQLDPARVRERLAELEQSIAVQRRVVDALDEATGDARRELSALDRQWADLKAHPAVAAALARGES